MKQERRLGRGLEALLGHPIADEPTGAIYNVRFPDEHTHHLPEPADGADGAADGGIVYLDVHHIGANRFQPRQDFDDFELDQLAESIRQHGVIQPIVVRRVADGGMELISGERRLRAAIKAGWTRIPACVRQADDRQVAEVAIVENVQRKDLNPLEKAASFQRYLDTYGGSQQELAERIQMDRSTIGNLIRLLELPAEVQNSLRGGLISQGHARALLPLGDDAEQVRYCHKILAEGLSVRAVEEMITEAIRQADTEPLAIAGSTAVIAGNAGASVLGEESIERNGPKKQGSRSQHLTSLEQELRAALGTKVEIRETTRHRGKIVIHFKNQAEFERLRELLVEPAPGLQSDVG